jgi:hypothetical protein
MIIRLFPPANLGLRWVRVEGGRRETKNRSGPPYLFLLIQANGSRCSFVIIGGPFPCPWSDLRSLSLRKERRATNISQLMKNLALWFTIFCRLILLSKLNLKQLVSICGATTCDRCHVLVRYLYASTGAKPIAGQLVGATLFLRLRLRKPYPQWIWISSHICLRRIVPSNLVVVGSPHIEMKRKGERR